MWSGGSYSGAVVLALFYSSRSHKICLASTLLVSTSGSTQAVGCSSAAAIAIPAGVGTRANGGIPGAVVLATNSRVTPTCNEGGIPTAIDHEDSPMYASGTTASMMPSSGKMAYATARSAAVGV